MKLVIDGFPSKIAAKSWWDWYAGQGEQDVSLWTGASANATLSEPKIVNDEVHVSVNWIDQTEE